ncbi:MAG: amidase [Rhizobiaceae bacterium]|nr:amidase [Rhizobiaceae bacterium]
MRENLHELSIAEAGSLLRRRELSSEELTRHFLDRIEAINPLICAYVTPTPERAIVDARRADKEIAAGVDLGPLHGIPLALKDNIDTAGIRTTSHSHLHANRIPDEDAVVAKRLRAGGSVLLGKLALHEFAFAGPAWDLPFPPARNPWNSERFSGGSSSGSGAAVAAGLAMAALGTDTAGSIRFPATLCGVTGLKPTFGRVSRTGIVPLSYALDHCGPLTWSVDDCATVLNVIAGHDPADAGSAPKQASKSWSPRVTDVRGLRIGHIRHFYDGDEKSDPSVIDAMDDAIRVFGELGAEIRDVTLSSLHDYSACCMTIMFCEALAIHEADLKSSPEKFGAIMRDRLALASLFSAADLAQAYRLRRQLAAEVAAAFSDVDALVTAGFYGPAPRLENVEKFYLLKKPLLTPPFDVTGSPAMSVRNGVSSDGMPLGMQIAGRPFDETTVFQLAHAYERATNWHDMRPPL